jgi:Family of unknown function (DUF6152)
MKARQLLASAILCVIPAFGHHYSLAEFDVSRTVRISGTISKVEFSNPHVTFSLDVKNPDGTVTPWEVETAAPSALIRGGITKALLAKGTTIVVDDAYPAKDGSPKANGRTLILADGREFRWGPWEHDIWNPQRDPTWNWCEEAKPRAGDCIRVQAPVR